jgi:hypothetical protein
MSTAFAAAGVLWTPNRARAVRHGLWAGAALTLLLTADQVAGGGLAGDAHSYWAAWRNGLYSAAPEQVDAYLYSPAFAQVVWPLTLLPWVAFAVLWTGAVVAAYLWLLAPLSLEWRIPILALCLSDVASGNVWSFLAVALVLGFRRPFLWAVPLLTKVTPGVGALWFAARREWRPFVVVVAATAAVVGVSAAFAPELWRDWFAFLLHPGDYENPARETHRAVLHLPAAARLGLGLPVGLALTVYAARKDRPQLLPLAMLAASPVFNLGALGLLAAIPRLSRR